MIFRVKCESCIQQAECCIHLNGDVVETVILPRGWRSLLRQPGGMHTHDALTFICPRCGNDETDIHSPPNS